MRTMCHHHLVAYQLKWEENNSVEENIKRKKRKESGRREKEGKVCVGRGEEIRIGEREKTETWRQEKQKGRRK